MNLDHRVGGQQRVIFPQEKQKKKNRHGYIRLARDTYIHIRKNNLKKKTYIYIPNQVIKHIFFAMLYNTDCST